MMKRAFFGIGAALLPVLLLAVSLQVLASVAWWLTPPPAPVRAASPPNRHPIRPEAIHRVSEWPEDKTRGFDEARGIYSTSVVNSVLSAVQRRRQWPLGLLELECLTA